MNNLIQLPKPCSENWNEMQRVDSCKRNCAVCKTHVHDFSRASLTEIHQQIAAAKDEKICGNYHERHTTNSKKVYVLVNAMERKLVRIKLKRISVLLVIAILFLSGCARRHLRGKFAPHDSKKRHHSAHIYPPDF